MTNSTISPDYYKKGSIEVTDFISDQNMSFIEGNVVKYITRHRTKGEGAKDIQKVIHYAQMILELRYGEKMDAPTN